MPAHKIDKQKLIEVAFNLFLEKGYTLTSTQNICDALEVSKAGLYYYFDKKEELLDFTIDYSKMKFFEEWYPEWGRAIIPMIEPNIKYLIFILKMKFEMSGIKKYHQKLNVIIKNMMARIDTTDFNSGVIFIDILKSI